MVDWLFGEVLIKQSYNPTDLRKIYDWENRVHFWCRRRTDKFDKIDSLLASVVEGMFCFVQSAANIQGISMLILIMTLLTLDIYKSLLIIHIIWIILI